MVRKRIDAAGARRNKQVQRGGCRTGCAGTEDFYLGKAFLHERMEYLEVTSVSGRIITGWCAAHLREVRLVHEFRGGDRASDRAGIDEKTARLVGHPDAGRVAGTWADGERGHDLRPN